MGNCQQTTNKTEENQLQFTPKGKEKVKKAGDSNSKNDDDDTKISDSKFNMQDFNMLGQQPPLLRKPAPQFTSVGYFQGIKTVSLSQFKGKYVVLFFFPFDFSKTCHQEILSFSDRNDQFAGIHTQIIGCSMDSQYVHQNYCTKSRSEGGLGGLNFPLISDVNREISRKYGVLIEDGAEKGASFRSIFIIDRNQILRHSQVNDLDSSIEVNEVLRILKQFQAKDNFAPPQGQGQMSTQRSKDNNNMNQSNQGPRDTSNSQNDNLPSVLNKSRRASAAGVMGLQGLQAPGGQRASISQNTGAGMMQVPNKGMFTSQISNSVGGDEPQRKAPPGPGRKKSILKKKTLFDRIGGELQVRKFTDKVFQYIMEDTRINFFFNHCDIEKIKKSFSNYMVTMLGGPPNAYQGKDLARIHGHLVINLNQFEAFCQILEGTLVEFGMDDESIREFFIFVDPMKDFLVNDGSAKPLIDRIGGEKVLQKILNREYEVIEKETSLLREIPNLNMEEMKQVQNEFFKVALSKQGYTGKSMRDIHRQLHIQSSQFDQMIKALEKALAEFKVEGGSAQELLVLFEPNLQYKHLPKGKAPLYNRIGGHDPNKFFHKLMKITYQHVLKDSRIKEYFKNVDIQKVTELNKHLIILFLGGPMGYQGKNLRDAHWHLELTDAHFDAWKQCLFQAMRDLSQSEEIVTEVDEIIEPLRADIVSIIPNLVNRVGGEQVVQKATTFLFEQLVNDKRVKQFFPRNLDVTNLQEAFTECIIQALGVPNRYHGKSMQEAHIELNIDDMHFNIFKDFLQEGFKKENVPLSIIQEIGKVIETFRHQIVNRHSTIYEKIGGDQSLVHIVNYVLGGVKTDNTLKRVFKDTDIEGLKPKFEKYMTFLLGGPISYEGKSLRQAHKNLKITDEQYTVFSTHMLQGFLSLGTIDSQTMSEIGQIIEAMRGEVIKRPPTLYERLGGETVIPMCINVFVKKLCKDPKIGGFFEGKIDSEKHSARLTEFFTMLTGGYDKYGENTYQGPNLKTAHNGLVLSGGIFDRFCELLQQTMEAMGAENDEQREVLNLLESLRTEVIGNKQPTVLDRMGGDRVLTKITNIFFDKVEDHQTLASYFTKTNMTTHRTKFVSFLSSTIGGTNSYDGKQLKEAHWRLNLSNTQFNQFTELWKQAMNDCKIDNGLIKETLQFWETLRMQVVQRKDEFDESEDEDSDYDSDEDEDESEEE